MLSVATNDLIASIENSPSLLVKLNAPAQVSIEAAVSSASHTILANAYPAQTNTLDAILSEQLGQIADGSGKSNGVAFGKAVAEAIIALRSTMALMATRSTSARQLQGIGDQPVQCLMWPQTPYWKDVAPFALAELDSFLPPAPPSLGSQEYADAVNEVKSLGAVTSTTRTPEQTQIARFWSDGAGTYTPPGHWNLIAADLANQKGLSLGESARLMAMLNTSLSDVGIAAWKVKYSNDLWRPITAIREAGSDNNDATVADSSWTSLLITPPHQNTFRGIAALVRQRLECCPSTLAKINRSRQHQLDSRVFSAASLALPRCR